MVINMKESKRKNMKKTIIKEASVVCVERSATRKPRLDA